MVPMLLIIVKLVRMVLKESDLIAEYCDDGGEDSFVFFGWMDAGEDSGHTWQTESSVQVMFRIA